MKIKTYSHEPYSVYIIEDRKLKQEFKSTTVCKKGDTWNADKGMALAKLNAENKRDIYKAKVLWQQYQAIEKAARSMQKQIDDQINKLDERVYKRELEFIELENS